MKIFTIGRSSDCDIVYEDLSVSTNHAEISIAEDGTIILIDHSTNGTFVNGEVIHHTSCKVSVNDEIVFPGNNKLDWNILIPHINNNGQDNSSTNINETKSAPSAIIDQNANFESSAPAGKNNNETTSSELSFTTAFAEGMVTGAKNIFSLFCIVLLMILTCWIPYINVGVFIAVTSLAPLWAEGKVVNPLEIFSSRYRKVMGDYALTQLLNGLASLVLLPFMIIPALVLNYTWMLAPYMVVYKGMDFSRAFKASNDCTYGHKWTIFFLKFIFSICCMIIYMIISLILTPSGGYDDIYSMPSMSDGGFIGILVFTILLFISFASFGIGITGSIWKQLTNGKNLN